MKIAFNFLIIATFFSSNIFAQKIDQQFFNEANTFFSQQVKNGLINYKTLKNNTALKGLIRTIENADLSSADESTKKAFYINAYNLHVINAATNLYPIQSVQSEGGFFDRKKIKVAGESLTLNNLEKQKLLKPYKDGRFHFVLVCGALGCPPITNFAYQPAKLDAQLDQQSRLALNNSNFIKVNVNNVGLSQIFKWYPGDFGGNKTGILNFINKYRSTPIPLNAKVSYYDYDWSLNEIASTSSINSNGSKKNNESRYIVSSTIPTGSIELKVFNNLYSQRTTGNEGGLANRSTFFTSTLSALYGLTNRLNIGFTTKYRRVDNSSLPSSALDVFGSGQEGGSSRQGFTGFGPQIRFAPIEKFENFSIQSAFIFPIGKDLAGSSTQPYIDWNGAIWNTQFFNDFSIGNSFSLFTEIDFLLEDIGSSSEGHINRFSTPATLIFSYNPNNKTTLYALGGFSPYWQTEFDYFAQGGFGAKYQFTPNLELELLYTGFTNKFLSDTGGKAATYNVGFRFNL